MEIDTEPDTDGEADERDGEADERGGEPTNKRAKQ